MSTRRQEALSEAVTITGREMPPPGYFSVETQEVTSGYFQAMGIPLLRGRSFVRELPTAPHAQLTEVVINERFAREQWPDGDPVGRTLRYGHGNREYTIVGVVGDVRQHGVRTDAPARFVYTPLRYGDFSDYDARYLVLRTTDDVPAAAAKVRAALSDVSREVALLDARTMQQVILSDTAWDHLKLSLVLAFGTLAMLLAALGIYGTVARAVAARRREIGVRVALGSPPSEVLRLVMRQGVEAALTGLLLGLAAAWLSARWLASQFFDVSTADPVVYACAGALVLGVTLVACYLPARRAAMVDPMVALRCE